MQRLWARLTHHIVPSEHNAYQPHFLRRSWLLFFLLIALMAEGFLATNLMMRQSNEIYLAAVVPAEVVALTNTQRSQNGAGALTENPTLAKAAQAKANDMVAKGYFAHQSPDGKKPWDWMLQAGYSYRYAGENLAVRFVDSHDVVNAWMASPTHRANIVKPAYTQIGIGIANGSYQGTPATFVVQFFATPYYTDQKMAAAASYAVSGNVFNDLTQRVMRVLGRMQAEPISTTNMILGVVAALLLLTLVLTIAMHTHIQPTHALAAGSTIAAIVLMLFLANTRLLDTGNQTAAVLRGESGVRGGLVVLDDIATSTEAIGE